MTNILHIDRDTSVYKIMDMSLEGDYHIQHTDSGFAAFNLMKASLPDVVITDIDLPMMDGYEIMERMQADPTYAKVPVIVLTEEKNVATEEKCAKFGVVEVIKKPFVPSMLKSSIDRIVETIKNQTRLTSELNEIKDKSHRDALTGLWNKAYACTLIESMLENSIGGALFMIDMDNFKAINDNYGHDAGDQTLVMFADTLKTHMRGRDVAARVGGDEFLYFTPGLHNRHSLAMLAGRIIKELADNLKLFHFDTNTSVSIGISIYGMDGETFEDLYNASDAALYAVKSSGKNSYRFACDEKEDDETRSTTLMRVDTLHEMMVRKDDDKTHVYSPGLAVLTGIYQYIARQEFTKAVQILFTLTPKGGIVTDDDGCEQAAETLENLLREQLRRSDAMARYSKRQFLVLTLDANVEGILPLIERVVDMYGQTPAGETTEITYEIGSKSGQ